MLDSNEELALVVLAGGSGTRFGGLKQVEPIGPHGETILDYSVFDAMRSGFNRIVFVIRRDIEEQFRVQVGRRIERFADVEYVFQDFPYAAGIPGRNRTKPWGTAHAIMMASEVVRSSFGVVNADDFYGTSSFRLLSDHLRGNETDAALVGFELKNTLSGFGSVNRGVCQLDGAGWLHGVTEFHDISTTDTGGVGVGPEGTFRTFGGHEIVSMNMWGFRESFFENLAEAWNLFFALHGESESAEFYITNVVTNLISDSRLRCLVLPTLENWVGVTYREDVLAARQEFVDLVRRGTYPAALLH